MNETVQTAITAGLAEIERTQDAPVGPLGYGADVSCSFDIDPTMALEDPTSTTAIANATFRCWDCPRGALPPDDGKDSKDYGFDLRAYCNRGTTDTELGTLQARLASEARKDDRIDTIRVKITPTHNGAITTLRVEARITPADRRLAPFTLVVAVTSSTMLIEAIGGVS